MLKNNEIKNIRSKKLELVQLILNTEKPVILEKIEDILKKGKSSDWWDDISDGERESIEKGVLEADNGELIPHKETYEYFIIADIFHTSQHP